MDAKMKAEAICHPEKGGSWMKMRLPMILDCRREEALLEKLFCRSDIITKPGTKNWV